MTAAVSIPLGELLGVAMAEAEGDAGDAAVALLARAYAWAAERATDGYLPLSTLHRLTSHKAPAKVLAALEAAGLLAPQGRGYLLTGYLSANPSTAELEARRQKEAAKKAGQRRGDSPQVSPGDSLPVSPGESPGESPRDNAGDSAPPLSGSPLSPRAKNPGEETQGGRAGASLSPGDSPRDNPPPSRPESPRDSRPSSAPSGALPPQKRPEKYALGKRLARAWAAGVSTATGASAAEVTEGWHLQALESIARAHCEGLTGVALEARVSEIAATYVGACREVSWDRGKGFAPECGLAWLNAGRPPASPARPARSAPPQPPPAAGNKWKFAVDSREEEGGAS